MSQKLKAKTGTPSSRPKGVENEAPGNAVAASANEKASPENNGKDSPNRVKTRQDTDTARAQAFRKLLAALNEGFLSSDSEDSDDQSGQKGKARRSKKASRRRSKRRSSRRSKSKQGEQGASDDEEYVQPEELSADEYGSDMDFEDSAAPEKFDLSTNSGREAAAKHAKQQKRREEKKLILRIKMAKKSQEDQQEKDSNKGELRFEDIDWSGVDLETINEILARREELRQRQLSLEGGTIGEAAGADVTSSKLKKSSLAPPPVKIDRPKPPVQLSQDEEVSAATAPVAETDEDGDRMDVEEPEAQLPEQASITSILAAAQASDEAHGLMTSESAANHVEEVQVNDEEEEDENGVATKRTGTPGKRGRPRGRPRGRGRGGRIPGSKSKKDETEAATPLHLPPKPTPQDYLPEVPGQAMYTPVTNRLFQTNFGNIQQQSLQYRGGPDSAASTIRRSRVHPALVGGLTGGQASSKRDMRVVLQYELSHEQSLLKSLQAEMVDKLAQLKTEERLLRIIVGDKVTLSDDEEDQDSLLPDYGLTTPKPGQFSPQASKDLSVNALYSQYSQQMDVDMPSHKINEGDSSLSDMSDSEGSEDEEVARNALRNLISQIDEAN